MGSLKIHGFSFYATSVHAKVFTLPPSSKVTPHLTVKLARKSRLQAPGEKLASS